MSVVQQKNGGSDRVGLGLGGAAPIYVAGRMCGVVVGSLTSGTSAPIAATATITEAAAYQDIQCR